MILVTGGTGFLGQHLIQQLVRKGHRVRAISRKKIESTKQVEWLPVDILDIDGLFDAFEGITNVYHCAGHVSFHPKQIKTMMDINVTGTANVVNMASQRKIKKLVHVSSIAALGRAKDGQKITEETKWQKSKYNSNYAISKYLGELEVWRAISEGLQAVIVNPSVILGEGDWMTGTSRLFSIVDRGLRFYTTGTNGFVDVKDVASVMIQLMDSDRVEERFVVSGEDVSYQQIFNWMAESLEKKKPSMHVSPILGAIAWRLAYCKAWIDGKEPLVTKETIRTGSHHFLYNGDKVREQLDFEFTPIKETISRSAKAYKNNKPNLISS